MEKSSVRVAGLAEPEAWRAFQTMSGVPSHGWAFNRALRHSGREPRLASVGSRGEHLIFPFHERTYDGFTDIVTTQGISGAAMSVPDQGLLDTWRDYAASRGWVAGYLQMGPEVAVAGLRDCRAGNPVFLLDIGRDDWMTNCTSVIRNKIRSAIKGGHALVTDRALLGRALARLYPETMARRNAGVHYRLASETLMEWAASDECLALGAACGDEVVAGVLFVRSGMRAEYHISASTEAGRDLTAWLISEAIERLRQHGVTTVNLGGGVKPGDGLHAFKARFGGTPRHLHAIRQIYRPDVYDRLCRSSGVASGNDWFPAYRARPASL